MRTLGVALLVSLASAGLALGAEATFEFTVSGDLASKLEPDTRVLVWSPAIETKPNWAHLAVKDMPASVPYHQLSAKHAWIASFISPAQRRAVFSMALAPELFDRPRRIDVKLDRPTPQIKPQFAGKQAFYYHAGVTQRMWYWSLPFWDKANKRIVAAEPPLLKIVRIADGTILQESAMQEGCMGSKWWATLDPAIELADQTELQLSVRYDSGGLWEPVETKRNFTLGETDDD